MATNSAYQQLQQALESATNAAKSLRGDLSASGRTALRDFEKRIGELRKEIEKNGRSWLSEIEGRVSGVISAAPPAISATPLASTSSRWRGSHGGMIAS